MWIRKLAQLTHLVVGGGVGWGGGEGKVTKALVLVFSKSGKYFQGRVPRGWFSGLCMKWARSYCTRIRSVSLGIRAASQQVN